MNNGEKDIALRRYHNILMNCGIGVIAFSILDMGKIAFMWFLGDENDALSYKYFQKLVASEMEDFPKEYSWILWVMVVSILLIILGVVLLVHLYIGLNAYRAGKGTAKKRKILYLVFAAVALLLDVFSLFSDVVMGFFENAKAHHDGLIATVLVNLTLIFIYSEMIYSAGKIMGLEKLTEQEA